MKKEEIQILELNRNNFNDYMNEIKEVMEYSYSLNFPHEKELDVDNKFNKLLAYKFNGNAEIYVAVEGKCFLGYIWFFKKDNERIHLNEIAVIKEAQSIGVGHRLVKKMEEFARKCDIKQIELFCMENNANAKKFYEHIEFYTEKRILVKEI